MVDWQWCLVAVVGLFEVETQYHQHDVFLDPYPQMISFYSFGVMQGVYSARALSQQMQHAELPGDENGGCD